MTIDWLSFSGGFVAGAVVTAIYFLFVAKNSHK